MSENIYDPLTYGGLVNRIRDGKPLTQHQKAVMAKLGLTEDDFRNQLTTEQKVAIINEARALDQLESRGLA
jgi:hypothetical protein